MTMSSSSPSATVSLRRFTADLQLQPLFFPSRLRVGCSVAQGSPGPTSFFLPTFFSLPRVGSLWPSSVELGNGCRPAMAAAGHAWLAACYGDHLKLTPCTIVQLPGSSSAQAP
uniref:Uncharacterized protein n=1 Tax=Arundo donax TaxID=35708 RepID=A0A0A8XWX0_ARUDO